MPSKPVEDKRAAASSMVERVSFGRRFLGTPECSAKTPSRSTFNWTFYTAETIDISFGVKKGEKVDE
jgi:hypothetical protein